MNEHANAWLARWQRERPGLYAGRHVAKGIGTVLLGLIGIVLSLRLPALALPDIPLPDLSLPDSVRVVLRSAKYWAPILVGVLVALRELHRRGNGSPEADER